MGNQLDVILDLLHPRLDASRAHEFGFDDAQRDIEEERDRAGGALEGIADATDNDVLTAALAEATTRLNAAAADRRRLLAFARCFNPGAAYPREVLADACGKTEGWVRAAFDDDDVAEVARVLGIDPVRPDRKDK